MLNGSAYISASNGISSTGFLQFNAGGNILLNAQNATGISLAGAPVTVSNQNFTVTAGTTTFTALNTAGIVTNTSGGLLGTSTGTWFIKMSGGVLSYDNTIYAPIASPTFVGTVTTGALVSTSATFSDNEAIKIVNSGGYLSFYNSANTFRTGYIQGNYNGNILFNAENATSFLFSGATVNVSNQLFTVTGGKVLVGSGTDFGTGVLQVTGATSLVGNTSVTGSLSATSNITSSTLSVINTGSLSAAGDNGQYATVSGANKTLSYGANSGQLWVVANDATPTADYGGSIGLGATYLNGAGGIAINAAIKSGRDDGTSGNVGGYLAFSTRGSGANITERARISSVGNMLIGQTADNANGKLQVTGNGYFTGNLTSTQLIDVSNTSYQVTPSGVSHMNIINIEGGVRGTVAALSSNAVLTYQNNNITGGTSYSLPDATTNSGAEITVYNSTSGSITITTVSSQLIGNYTTATTFSILSEGSNTFVSNGTKYLLK
jgi:hypothetical protein